MQSFLRYYEKVRIGIECTEKET